MDDMLFGTSGIRGIYGKDITEKLACSVAHAFAESNVAIGRDTRSSGQALFHAAASGVLSKGYNTIDLGIVPTPTVALATKKHNIRGIMITASHNPEEYNGLKLLENGKEISKEQEKKITAQMEKEGFSGKWDMHSASMRDDAIIDDHKSLIKKLVDEKSIAKKKPKVIIDCNGAGAAITPYLLSDLGCHVVSINAELQGFNRLPEPTANNLQKTLAIVRATAADFGIAHDGDADRAIIIDETGQLIGLDVQLALAIEQELEHAKNKLILTTVEASLLVRETIERCGGKYEISPVGSTYLSHKLEKANAIFAGEPCGEYIYSKGVPCPDGILVAAKFAQLFADKGHFSNLAKRFKPYPMVREKFACIKKPKADVIEKIKQEISIEGKRNDEDGMRIDEKDGWFLIRASGTEPAIRLTAEYKDKKKLEERAVKLRAIIQSSIL